MHSIRFVLANVSGQLSSSEDPLPVGLAPRYAEHFVGAAALLGAFGLLFGAMALGEGSCQANAQDKPTVASAWTDSWVTSVQERGYCSAQP